MNMSCDSEIITNNCYLCGSEMLLEEREDVITFDNKSKTIRTLGWWCVSCGEAIFDGVALHKRELAYLELKNTSVRIG